MLEGRTNAMSPWCPLGRLNPGNWFDPIGDGVMPREYSAISRPESLGPRRCHAKQNIRGALEIRQDNGEARIKEGVDQTSNITKTAISAAGITTRSLDTLGKAHI